MEDGFKWKLTTELLQGIVLFFTSEFIFQESLMQQERDS